MRTWGILAALGVMALAGDAAAQKQPGASAQVDAPSEAQHALARRYISIGGAEETFLESAFYGFKLGVETNGVRANEDQWRRIRLIVREDLTDAAHTFMEEIVGYYAANSTAQDLTAAITFYETPNGVRYVAATMETIMPIIFHFSTNRAAPLPEPPDVAALDADRLEAAQGLARVMVERMTPLEALAMEQGGFGQDRFADHLSRNFAQKLSLAEIGAAAAWARSEPSQRIEGASLERSQALQMATMRAMANANFESITQSTIVILREEPPT